MKYYVVEEDNIVKPLYKSSFPLVKKARWESLGATARLVKQFKFRKTLHLYVDDVESYRTLGGCFGARRVERFRALDYPSWSQLTGIKTYSLPEFQPAPVIKGGFYPDCYIITQVDHNGDIVTLHSELLQKADSSDSLTEVTSVYFEYIKSWGITINKESAEQSEERSVKSFKKRLRDSNIQSLESAYALIDRMLDPNPHDSGIVRKSKAIDLNKFRSVAKEMIKCDHPEELEFVSVYFLPDDIWNAAKHLYELQGDYSFYYVYDDTLIDQLVLVLEKLKKEAEYLSNGLYNHTVDLIWAKDKMKELRSELNEAGFPFNERGDTEYHWKRFNEISQYIERLETK